MQVGFAPLTSAASCCCCGICGVLGRLPLIPLPSASSPPNCLPLLKRLLPLLELRIGDRLDSGTSADISPKGFDFNKGALFVNALFLSSGELILLNCFLPVPVRAALSNDRTDSGGDSASFNSVQLDGCFRTSVLAATAALLCPAD